MKTDDVNRLIGQRQALAMKGDDQERIKAYMAAKMKHIKMYNECTNLVDGLDVEQFAGLVRADEREACAEVCDLMYEWGYNGASDCAEAIRARVDDLQTTIEKGTQAWADVPDATDWVEELRGDDKPPVKSYCGGKPNYCTPEVTTEVPCKTHPDAPHGFDRNASHNADRYVCECESWEPPEETFILDRGCYERGCVAYDERDGDGVYMSGKRVHKTDKSIHEPVAWMLHGELFWPSEYEVISEAGDNAIPLYTAPPKRDSSSWVGLTDEERFGEHTRCLTRNEWALVIEAKLKEKNHR